MSDALCWFLADVFYLEQALETKYGAQGETLREKVACLKGKAPKRVVDNLEEVVRVYERARSDDIPTDDELLHAKRRIDAYDRFAAPDNRFVNWIVWGVLVAIVIYVSWRFLPH